MRDADKIDAFIKHRRALNPQCPYVEKFHEAQNNMRDIEKDARNMHDFFLRHVRAMEVLNAPQDAWISEVSYRELQALATIPSAKDRRIALGTIIGQTKSQCTLYHELKFRHVVIDFYSDARTHFRNSSKEQSFKHGGRPQRHR